MKLKLQNPFIFRYLLLSLLFLFCIPSAMSQQLYVGADGLFYLAAEVSFTTSNSVVEVNDDGDFVVEAGSDWGSPSEYVNGKVTALGAGTSILPVGDNGVYAPVSLDHTCASGLSLKDTTSFAWTISLPVRKKMSPLCSTRATSN